MSESVWIELQAAFWPVAVGIACNTACGLLGCFLVLRRMSLLGDAISHAVLPGLAVAYLLSGQLGGWPIFIGALAMGLLTALLTQTLHSQAGVREDASMGVVFTTLFAVGVVLITRAAAQSDLDPGCVLYGMIEYVGINTQPVLGYPVPRAMVTLGTALAATLVFILLFWKELKLSSFDPALATAMGLSGTTMHYLLMGMVAAVTVASFEAVGSVVVVAMLVAPGATAHLLTDRLSWMLVTAALVGVLAAVAGYAVALWLNTSLAGAMAGVLGLQFGLAVCFAPRHGLVSRWLARAQLGVRIVAEDILARLYRREESLVESPQPDYEPEVPVSMIARWMARWQLLWRGEVVPLEATLRLTERGRQRAQSLVRSHRLWEAYLEKNLQLPLDHLHEPAERMEHFIDEQLQEALQAELGVQDVDPHGRPIPPGTD